MVSFIDVDECSVMPDICGTAVCKNIPGDFECECTEGYRYNPVLKACEGRVVVVSIIVDGGEGGFEPWFEIRSVGSV